MRTSPFTLHEKGVQLVYLPPANFDRVTQGDQHSIHYQEMSHEMGHEMDREMGQEN